MQPLQFCARSSAAAVVAAKTCSAARADAADAVLLLQMLDALQLYKGDLELATNKLMTLPCPIGEESAPEQFQMVARLS